MTRLFVAIEVPDAVRRMLGAMCYGVPGARWVAEENLHLTLRFIGEVDNLQLDDIGHALARVRGPEFEMTLDSVGQFESRRQPRVLWVGVAPNEPLVRLHDAVESALVRVGLEPEGRKFSPHITLARLKAAPRRKMASFVADHALFRAGPFPVTSFTLFSSFLARNGAIHRVENEYPLRAA